MSANTATATRYIQESLNITGLDCPNCAAQLEQAMRRVPGVIDLRLIFASGQIQIKYDPRITDLNNLLDKIHLLGYEVSPENPQAEKKEHTAPLTIRLSGLDCPDCAAKLEKSILALPGVESGSLNFGASTLNVNYSGPPDEIMAVIKKMGYSGKVESARQLPGPKTFFWKTNPSALSTIFSGLFVLMAFILQHLGAASPLTHILYIAGIICGGYLPARSGLLMLINGRQIDMNILMIVAVAGAVIIGQFEEAATVVFLFALGNTLQAYSLDKTRKSITTLMDMTPSAALIRRNGLDLVLPVDDIRIGDIMVVKPGERIAMDGRVLSGTSAVDQAAITGESLPVLKKTGDEVYAGTLNQRGAMEIEVTKLSSDNTIARLIKLVEEAQGQRAQSQQLVDRFARYYTPIVIAAAALVAVIPPLALNQPWHEWTYEALAMLLVACPCALVISTPVAIVSAIGNAAKQGILIKGGIYLEQMAALSVVAFDKTGTLTQGQPEVTNVVPLAAMDENQILIIAAAIENYSEHPLGNAIVQYARHQRLEMPAVTGFEAITGLGAKGIIDGCPYHIGNQHYMETLQLPTDKISSKIENLQNQGKTVMLLGNSSELLGIIAVADIIRPVSRQAINDLKKAGIKKVLMLTGDNTRTARAIAAQAGVDDFRAELLPEDKVGIIKDLLASEDKVAMVGDGVNDAPAMATATVGIAMGAAGTDTALETADVALMADDLSKLPYIIKLSHKTVGIIKQNITAALIIKTLILLLVIPGMLTMWLAVVGDMGASLLVTLNGLRLLRVKAYHK